MPNVKNPVTTVASGPGRLPAGTVTASALLMGVSGTTVPGPGGEGIGKFDTVSSTFWVMTPRVDDNNALEIGTEWQTSLTLGRGGAPTTIEGDVISLLAGTALNLDSTSALNVGTVTQTALTLGRTAVTSTLKGSTISIGLDAGSDVQIGNATATASTTTINGKVIALGNDLDTTSVTLGYLGGGTTSLLGETTEMKGTTVNLSANSASWVQATTNVYLGTRNSSPTQFTLNTFLQGVNVDVGVGVATASIDIGTSTTNSAVINLGNAVSGNTTQVNIKANTATFGDASVTGTTTNLEGKTVNVGVGGTTTNVQGTTINVESTASTTINIGTSSASAAQVTVGRVGGASDQTVTTLQGYSVLVSGPGVSVSGTTTTVSGTQSTFVGVTSGTSTTIVRGVTVDLGESATTTTTVKGASVNLGESATTTTAVKGVTVNLGESGSTTTTVKGASVNLGESATTTTAVKGVTVNVGVDTGTANTYVDGGTSANLGTTRATLTRVGRATASAASTLTDILGDTVQVGTASDVNTVLVGHTASTTTLTGATVGIGGSATTTTLNGSLKTPALTVYGALVSGGPGSNVSTVDPGAADNVMMSNGTHWTSTPLTRGRIYIVTTTGDFAIPTYYKFADVVVLGAGGGGGGGASVNDSTNYTLGSGGGGGGGGGISRSAIECIDLSKTNYKISCVCPTGGSGGSGGNLQSSPVPGSTYGLVGNPGGGITSASVVINTSTWVIAQANPGSGGAGGDVSITAASCVGGIGGSSFSSSFHKYNYSGLDGGGSFISAAVSTPSPGGSLVSIVSGGGGGGGGAGTRYTSNTSTFGGSGGNSNYLTGYAGGTGGAGGSSGYKFFSNIVPPIAGDNGNEGGGGGGGGAGCQASGASGGRGSPGTVVIFVW